MQHIHAVYTELMLIDKNITGISYRLLLEKL